MRLLCQEEFYESENIFSAYVFCIPLACSRYAENAEKRKKPRLAKASRHRTIFRRCGIIVCKQFSAHSHYRRQIPEGPGMLKTTVPLKIVLDRRPFI